VEETSGVRLTDEDRALVEANLALIYFVAGRYRGIPPTAFEDLIGRLYYRLCLCVSRFDPSRGFKISPYLVRSLEGDAKNFFRDSIWTVRPPRRLREGRPPLPEEEGIGAAIESCVRPLSLDVLIERPEGELGGLSALTATEVDVEAEVVDRIGGRQVVMQLMRRLRPEERFMLSLMMKGQPLKTVQERFGLTLPQARRVWQELQEKSQRLYLAILDGEHAPESTGSEALAEILRKRFEPEDRDWFAVRQAVEAKETS
jgi:RNA polymerase sigma factor (sigma-70 family)